MSDFRDPKSHKDDEDTLDLMRLLLLVAVCVVLAFGVSGGCAVDVAVDWGADGEIYHPGTHRLKLVGGVE